MLELDKTHIGKNGKEIKIIKYNHLNSSVVYEFIGSGNVYVLPYEEFKQHFKIKQTSKTLNKDIIKLIESGYEFKSFYGTTFDGKEFHVEMQPEEEDQAFKINVDDLF